jgi:KaiC/GvpD/RAD55 family RecA-like ATPase
LLDRQSIASLDAFVGALAAKRVHILSGSTGTGKTAVSMRFLHAGLRHGERGVLLTAMRPGDIRALATHVGLELEAAIAEDRLVILRHGRELTGRLGRPGALHSAVDELRALTESIVPGRIVIDSIAPFLADEGASAAVIARLTSVLEALGATGIVTVPGRLGDSSDRRLEPLLQDAAAVFHFAAEPDGTVAVEPVTLRATSFAPLPSRITLGRVARNGRPTAQLAPVDR